MKPIAHYMEEKGVSVAQLVAASGLDSKLVAAIVSGNYTPSPLQRQRLAAALEVSIHEISWGHAGSCAAFARKRSAIGPLDLRIPETPG